MADNKDKKVLNVPALRFPEFTEEWKRIRVSDLLDFYSTNSLSWEQLEYKLNEPYNLHYGLIHVGLPILVDLTKDELPSIKEGNVPKKYELCKEGDVAFADASEDTNEVAKVVEFYNLDGKKVVCGLHTIHGRDNNKQTAKGFLGYCFSSTVFHYQIRRIAQGTKIYSINTRNFSEAFVGLPSKSEQHKIATLLKLIDERISTQNKIIEKYESLIQAIIYKEKMDGISKGTWQRIALCKVLQERNEKNVNGRTICSVSVSLGVVNQVEYLGRSFAAKQTSHYNIVKYGDIVYTKSPTGNFPYGIIKRSNIREDVAVSPLYGVYIPASDSIGVFLHFYFMQPSNAFNYLYPLIQKGAKNTINITNGRFLENSVPLPISRSETNTIAGILKTIQTKIEIEKNLLQSYTKEKSICYVRCSYKQLT